MPFSLFDSRIFASQFSDPDIVAIFSDEAFVRYLLKVEAALAEVQGQLGIIPVDAAQKIVVAAETLNVDFAALQTGTERAGVPIIDLVRQLRANISDGTAAYVHWGATTQDIIDTALVLQIRAALAVMEPNLVVLIKNLAALARQHHTTLMAGRTHSQQALPIPFGLKVAGWLAPLLRHHQRLAEMKPRLLLVQFGGAAGTLASLQAAGLAVQQALADKLGLSVPAMPWHTQRDTLAELAGWLSLLSGGLAKMAQDIILMAQSEVGEVRESADIARGGSSTMPQKSNPIISELIIAGHRSNASLLAAMHQALVQEHERATHGWQVEWLNLPQMFALTGAALNKALFLSENLVVNSEQMRQNVAASNGLMLAEAINFALADYMDRAEAKKLVAEACRIAFSQNRHLVDVVQSKSDAPLDWAALRDETAYFGSSEAFINRVVQAADQLTGAGE